TPDESSDVLVVGRELCGDLRLSERVGTFTLVGQQPCHSIPHDRLLCDVHAVEVEHALPRFQCAVGLSEREHEASVAVECRYALDRLAPYLRCGGQALARLRIPRGKRFG